MLRAYYFIKNINITMFIVDRSSLRNSSICRAYCFSYNYTLTPTTRSSTESTNFKGDINDEGVDSEGVGSEGVSSKGVGSEGVSSDGVGSKGVDSEGVNNGYVNKPLSLNIFNADLYNTSNVKVESPSL